MKLLEAELNCFFYLVEKKISDSNAIGAFYFKVCTKKKQF